MKWYLWLCMILGCLGQLSDCITTQIGLAHGAVEMNPLFHFMQSMPWTMYAIKLSIPPIFTVILNKLAPDYWYNILIPLIFAGIGFYAGVHNYLVIRGMG